MAYLDIYKHLNQLFDADCLKQATDIRVALDSFPNLQVYNHKGSVILLTPDVNQFVDTVIYETDSTGRVFAKPHLTDKQVVLFASPAIFCIAQDNPNGFGLLPYEGWEAFFEQYQINPALVKQIQSYLRSRAPVNY